MYEMITQDLLDRYNISKPQVILIMTQLIRNGLCRRPSQAISILESGEYEREFLLDLVIDRFITETEEDETEIKEESE